MKLIFFIIVFVLFIGFFQYFDISQFLAVFNGTILSPLAAFILMLGDFARLIFSFYYLKLVFFIVIIAMLLRFVLSWITGGEK